MASDASPSPRVEVNLFRGAPCLHVNGIPQTGLAFWHSPIPAGKAEWQEFARCGVHIFQLDISAWSEPTDWDERLRHTIAADPEARIWLRVGTTPPQSWLDAHADHIQLHHDENNGDHCPGNQTSWSCGPCGFCRCAGGRAG